MEESMLAWLFPEVYSEEQQSETMHIQDCESTITDRPTGLELEFAASLQ